MTTDELDKLLQVLRKHDVAVFKDGDLLLQLNPKIPEFGTDVSPQAMAGGWKRSPNLDSDQG